MIQTQGLTAELYRNITQEVVKGPLDQWSTWGNKAVLVFPSRLKPQSQMLLFMKNAQYNFSFDEKRNDI